MRKQEKIKMSVELDTTEINQKLDVIVDRVANTLDVVENLNNELDLAIRFLDSVNSRTKEFSKELEDLNKQQNNVVAEKSSDEVKTYNNAFDIAKDTLRFVARQKIKGKTLNERQIKVVFKLLEVIAKQ